MIQQWTHGLFDCGAEDEKSQRIRFCWNASMEDSMTCHWQDLFHAKPWGNDWRRHAILDVILESSEIISIFHSYASDVASFILGGL